MREVDINAKINYIDHDTVITLRHLSRIEAKDAEKYWDYGMPEFEDLAHLVLHNSKMLGLLASLCEVGQHAARGDMKQPKLTTELKKRIIGNYLIWAVHYARVWGLSLSDCYSEKQDKNIKRALIEQRVHNGSKV